MVEEVLAVKCWLCGSWLPVQISTKQRPYLVCPKCEMVIFVNGHNGISSLQGKAVKKKLSETLYTRR